MSQPLLGTNPVKNGSAKLDLAARKVDLRIKKQNERRPSVRKLDASLPSVRKLAASLPSVRKLDASLPSVRKLDASRPNVRLPNVNTTHATQVEDTANAGLVINEKDSKLRMDVKFRIV